MGESARSMLDDFMNMAGLAEVGVIERLGVQQHDQPTASNLLEQQAAAAALERERDRAAQQAGHGLTEVARVDRIVVQFDALAGIV